MSEILLAIGLCLAAFSVVGIAGLAAEWIALLLIYVSDQWKERTNMRIIKLKAENIKRLKAVEITPTGDVVQVTGRNGQGKSSLLDAIWWALGGTKNIQGKPIRKGQRKAKVELDLGKYIVTREFSPTSSKLHIAKRLTESTATVGRPQEVLDGLLNKVAFDPLKFMRMKPAAQAETLRGLVGLDTTQIDAEKEKLSVERRELGRSIPTTPPEAGPDPGPEKSVDEAMRLLADAQSVNAKHAAAERYLTAANDDAARADLSLGRLESTLAEAKADVARAKAELTQCETTCQEASAALKAIEPPPAIDGLQAAVSGAAEHNRLVEAYRRNRETVQADTARREVHKGLSDKIRSCEEKRQEMIQAAEMPLEGLSFDDYGEITFGGFPLDQASQAEQLRISLEIAMAAQPELRIIRITDGSLLDSASLEAIRKAAADGDYQIWIESVDETGKVGVVIEDGTVVADNQAEAK